MPRKTKSKRRQRKKDHHNYLINDKVGSLVRYRTPNNHYIRQVFEAPVGSGPLLTVPGILQQQMLDQAAAFDFELDLLDQFSTLQGLFDQYRIVAIKANFIPLCNIQGSYDYSLGTNIPARMFTALDHDDANVPGSAGVLRQKETCLEHNMYKPFHRWIKPHTAAPVYTGAIATSAYTNAVSPWIDSQYTDVPHFGMKVYVVGAGIGSNRFDSMALEFEMYAEFREVS